MRKKPLSGLKPRIAVLFPSFLGGGAEAVCLWMLEALRQDHELTLHTFSDIEFGLLNRYYGTDIPDGQVGVIHPFAVPILNRIAGGSRKLFTLRQHLMMRHFKRDGDPRDLRISAFNEMDLGARGIQYIHYPLFGGGHETARAEVGAPDSKSRAVYRSLCRTLSEFSDERMKTNLTIANSRWTAAIVKRIYGIDARVIYPPVSGDFPKVPWERKRNGFVVLGRLVHEKRVEKAISIVKSLRRGGLELQLCIAGGSGDPAYLRYLRGQLRGSESWAILKTDLTRRELGVCVAGYRYGLHVRENEQFGIAVAEMVRAGCIPFVSSRGGQTEIVGNSESLLFDDERQAVEKIARVISRAQTQRSILQVLKKRGLMFSAARFMAEIRDAVQELQAG
jgi:glycosyltransferase involved in cell wall biosynthesis